jgi:hypothetical protein
MKLDFSRHIFEKNTEIPNFMKIRPMESELFHSDIRTEGRTERRTDMTKLIFFLRKFANAPKNNVHVSILHLLTGLVDGHGMYLLRATNLIFKAIWSYTCWFFGRATGQAVICRTISVEGNIR